MNVKKKYAKVVQEWKAGNCKTALKLLNKVRANEIDTYYIEAAIYHELKSYVRAYRALKKMMPMMSKSSPDYEEFINNLASCSSDLGLIDECLKLYHQIMNITQDKTRFYDAIEGIIFAMNTKEDVTAEEYHAIFDKFRSSFKFEPFPRRFYNHAKIRVGFLSGDFGNHVVMKWSWYLVTGLDKNQFEVYAYSNTTKQDEVTEQLRPSIDYWQDILEMTDEQAANLIRDDEIDIAFDLSGHIANNRLGVLAYRPASVQISGIGFVTSTGLKTVDYFLTDVHCLGDSAPYFTEDFIVMSNTHDCWRLFDYIDSAPITEPPCLKNGYVTFGCFNHYRKITDSMLTTWKKIMDAVPNSRLLLDTKIFDMEGGKEFVRDRLRKFGFDLKHVDLRYNLKPYPLDYEDVDIALDTFPYVGLNITAEALYMGVPVISLYGDRHSTRCGLSILKNVGLDDLAVDNYEDYVKRAVMLANDWELLSMLRRNLRTMIKKSPLMDTKSYVREMEETFIEVLDAARNAQ